MTHELHMKFKLVSIKFYWDTAMPAGPVLPMAAFTTRQQSQVLQARKA